MTNPPEHRVRIACCQVDLQMSLSPGVLEHLRQRVRWCENDGVDLLCCPEAVLGGLADYQAKPFSSALDAETLPAALSPLASDTVTVIVGFTERDTRGRLFNSAAVLQRGKLLGVYRKRHPAINHSVYHAGDESPVFQVRGLTFGLLICNDSNFPELARRLKSQGAAAIFIPTNNGLPAGRAGPELVTATRAADVRLAAENGLWVARADVTGRTDRLISHGSSSLIDPRGNILREARLLTEDLLVVDVGPLTPR